MLKIKNVSKRHGKVTAINRVSFAVEEGERLVILGPSGSGKTTLLRLIAGLEVPDEGEIFIDGIKASVPGKIITPPNQRQIGMIFQNLALWPHMRAAGNVRFALSARELKREEKEKKIRDILAKVGLEAHLERYPHQLSGGEQQRLAIARTLVLEPGILLMDEPFASVDEELKRNLSHLLLALQERLKITLLYVTHNKQDAGIIGRRILRLKEGGIADDLPAEDTIM